jgi:glycosyltransferase involved in cell wall biosynthesis
MPAPASGYNPPVAAGNATISVVVPCFNAERYIGQCVSACLDQEPEPCEIILVDDGSTDGTSEALEALSRQHPGRIMTSRQPNAGANSARARGVALARGDWLYLVDADDYPLPGAFAALGAVPDADIAFGNAIRVDEQGRFIDRRDQAPPVAHAVAAMLFRAPLMGSALVRRASSGPFWKAEHEKVGEFFYFASLAAHGARACHVEADCVAYRQHDAPTRLTNRAWDLSAALGPAFLELSFSAARDSVLASYIAWALRDLALRSPDPDAAERLRARAREMNGSLLRMLPFATRWYGPGRVARILLDAAVRTAGRAR